MCEKSGRPPTGPQLQHAIKRNFGGLDDFNTYEIVKNYLPNIEKVPELSSIGQDHELLNPDCTPLGLIRKSLQTKETSWHEENRYLLFLTENYAALQVIKHFLHEEIGIKLDKSLEALSSRGNSEHRMEPFVLFGSSFPKDREYTQVCRNINLIKICMETGRTVILLNLKNLYESLYNLLNQYYIILAGGQRYVDLGLQTHRVKCRVHNDFKLILIAEMSTVYEKFPPPLINRLEKHILQAEIVLQEEWQKEVHMKLTFWVEQFSKINGTKKR
ncbi:PREDICTED: E3 ubiquitin-protein ligase rnf213-alpha-like [Amphimedon queenslandica]|uniref:Uncharacterized protein n=1 Tax=Amphimedon queenslandica TaxID=400682 RepID=A0AAN0JZ78_AMPQE|nr:PREDICTED: E3 ubiquitin-protein ligase rnf213-alpha-like [Amphimedon queenslandica]|eukprot:XP_019862305.1 PREDICTED: E3 ubiquitin-protein ligase rnf213-alpha-like [Amphimedon queenslandica]